jgi:hypothetical protein
MFPSTYGRPKLFSQYPLHKQHKMRPQSANNQFNFVNMNRRRLGGVE